MPDAEARPSKSIAARGVEALFWGTGGAALRMALQVLATAILARLLGPEQYGIFAACAVVITLSNLLGDVGLAYGLIQKAEVTDDDIRFVVAWQIVLGVAVAGGVVVASPWIAGYFGEPRAEAVLPLMALVCLAGALSAPSLNLLKRKLDFRGVQIASIVSYVIGFFGVGVPLALNGAGVWALAAAWVTQALAMLLMLYALTRHPWQPLLWYAGGAAQWRYAFGVFGTNLFNWISANIDRVVVARVFPTHQVGLYTTSLNLVYSPGAAVAGVLQPLLFSAASRSSQDSQRLARVFRSGIVLVVLIVCPPFLLVAIGAAPFVDLLLGKAWAGASELIVPLALAMPMFAFAAISTPFMWTLDRTSRELRLQLPLTVLMIAMAVVASTHSVVAVAWAIAASYALRALVMGLAAARACRLTRRDAPAILVRPLLLTLLLAAGSAGVMAATATWPPLARLALATAAWGGGLLLALRFGGWFFNADARYGISLLLARSPALAARFDRIAKK